MAMETNLSSPKTGNVAFAVLKRMCQGHCFMKRETWHQQAV